MTPYRPLQKVRNPWIIVPVVAGILLTLGTFWFLNHYEKKAFEEFKGGSPAAWKNPLLAAQRYLEASGKEAVGSSGISYLSSLPPPRGALFIRRWPRGLSKSIKDNLFSWVESGGHLLLTPNSWQNDASEPGDILARLGVQVQKGEDDCSCPPKSGDAAKKTTGKKNPKKTVIVQTKKKKATDGSHPHDSIIDLYIGSLPLHLKYFGAPLLTDSRNSAMLRINGSYRISYKEKADNKREDNNTIRNKNGDWLLQYRVGAGKITVLSENSPFTNQNIGDYDHAFFLSWLLRDDKTVRLLYSSDAKGLSTILWDKLPLFWVSLSVMLALGIWRLQKRSGSLLQPGTDEQLNILAHIDASGMFSWRMNGARTIIAANRKAIRQRWAERKFGHKQDQETGPLPAASLVAKTGFSEKDVFNAFRLRVESEQDLIKTSRALQKIHRRLHGGEPTRHDG
jgi:Domain of unknown function (DUF4350)